MPTPLSNHPLIQKAQALCQRYFQIEAELIDVLQQIDRAKLFRPLGYASLFQFCTQHLKLSEEQAYNLIQVGRKSVEVPKLKEALQSGVLTLSKARRITSVLTPETASLWIEKAASLSKSQLERHVAATLPDKPIEEKLKPVSQNRSLVVLGVSPALAQQLERVKELTAQSLGKPASLEDALEAMVALYLKSKDPVAKAIAKGTPRKNTPRERTSNQSTKKPTIPAAVRQQVALRDRGLCQFRLPTGRPCHQKQWVDLHHIVPRSAGGKDTPQNLTTLCRAHHQIAHEFVLGRGPLCRQVCQETLGPIARPGPSNQSLTLSPDALP